MNQKILSSGLKVALLGQPPAALKKLLKKEPPSLLRSLIDHLDQHDEFSLNAAGQLRKARASLSGPLLLDVLEEISSGCRREDPFLAPLRDQLDKLHQVDLRLADADARVTLVDRINVLTDSPAEAEVKQLKSDRKEALRLLKQTYQEYHTQCELWRVQQEICFLHDRLIAVIESLARVSSRSGSSRSQLDCPLQNAETLNPSCDWLIEQQSNRHGFSGDYASLIEEVCAARPGSQNLPEKLKAHLGDALNAAVKAARLAASEHKEAGQATSNAQKKVTLLDKINIFSDSPREIAAKDARAIEAETAAAAQRAQDKIRAVLLEGLQNFPDASLYYLCEQLRQDCAAIHAVCRSKTVSSGYGDEREEWTEYYCEIVGLAEARRQAELCAASCHQYHGQMYGLYTHLTRMRAAQVRDEGLLELIKSSM